MRELSHPLEQLLAKALGRIRPLEEAPATAGEYLDTAEAIVRRAVEWLDEGGRVIDPWQRKEVTWATGRFVGALGGLVGAGRCADLTDALSRAVRRVAEILRRQRSGSGPRTAIEFFAKELAWALWHAGAAIEPAAFSEAAEAVSAMVPDEDYVDTLAHHSAEEVFNFNTFALAAEQMFRALNLRTHDGFIERHLPCHLDRFTELGLYMDPDAAMVYDAVPRVNLSTMLWAGYDGPLADKVGHALAIGALTQLLMHSADGLNWPGGRSFGYQFNEMELAVICEFEAQRWHEREPLLAGAFRAAARRGLRAIEPWLDDDPPRHIKNRFHPAVGWGFDSYGGYSVYLLLAASLMTFAYHFSGSDSCATLPAEAGQYAFSLDAGFHRILARSPGWQIQWDWAGDEKYDATGIVRMVYRPAAPWPFPAACPAKPAFSIPAWVAEGQAAACVSVSWLSGGQWARLAEAKCQAARLEWQDKGRELWCRVRFLQPDATCELQVVGEELELTWRVAGAEAVRAEFPLPVTDGREHWHAEAGPGLLRASSPQWAIEIRAKGAQAGLQGRVSASRFGLHQLAYMQADGDEITCRLQVSSAGG